MVFLQKKRLRSLQGKVQKAHQTHAQKDTDTSKKNLILAQYKLAKFYDRHAFSKAFPHARAWALECYRAVANFGEARASYICGQRLLEEGKFWDMFVRNPIYSAEVHKSYASGFYREALSYLQEADVKNYPLARRLLGLVFLHGWGVEVDMDRGYKLVIESIELEKSWDRATKIFAELKLNSPAFFSALMAYKKQ